MNKLIIASFLILPFVANANSINESKTEVGQSIQKQLDDYSPILKSTDRENANFKDKKNTTTPNRNVCLYEGKTYSQGAIITVSGTPLQCIDNQIMKTLDGNTENETFDMRWERVPSKGQ